LVVKAHPSQWPTVTLTKQEFNALPERTYPEKGRQCKRLLLGSWLRGTWISEDRSRPGEITEHYLWENIWVASI
jgi:hypothetical protein